MAVASLVLGILAIVFSIVGLGYQWIGAIAGIIGIVLAILARKDPEKKGLATAGLVCSIIGTVLCLIAFIACVGCLGAVGAGVSSLDPSSLSSLEDWLNSLQ